MATTPISASVIYNSTTPTIIYTVPATKTAIVKSVLASSLTASFDTVTLNKVSGGVTYPLVRGQLTGFASYNNSQYYPSNVGTQTINLLQSPVTLAAGDSISISTAGTSAYKTENIVDNSNYRIANINYLNGNYIAVGQDVSTGGGLILTSTDGITFIRRTFSANVILTNVTFGNGYYVVCNKTGGTIHYSTDLITWTEVALPSTNPCFALTYGGGKFVTGGSSGIYYYATTTPLSWTAPTIFNTDSIHAIAYIGTDYFFGVNGISYYTADFVTYTQPYVYLLGGNTNSRPGNFIVSNNKIYATNNLTVSGNPNTFLTSSTTGVTWSNVTTVANNIGSIAYMCYANNGGYMIYRQSNSGTNYYLYSSDGVTWAQTTYSSLTAANGSGAQIHRGAYDNTANATYNNKVMGYMSSSNTARFFCYNIGTNGTVGTVNWEFSSSTIPSGVTQLASVPCFVANPNDGSWIALGHYTQGGQYGVVYWYGTGPTQQGGDGQFVQAGYNFGQGLGYGVSAGVVPGSNRYLAGTTNGWVNTGSYTSIDTGLIGVPGYVTNPPGIVWNNISGTACVGFARSGDLATSTLVILWSNGQIAVTTNQCATFIQKSIGASSFSQMSSYGGSPIKYNNGMFVAINNSGLTLTSANGLDWSTMPSVVESIYYLNSENVFLSPTTLSTSATGVVNTFTPKTNPGAGANPDVSRMAYVGSTYYLMAQSAVLYSSSDLVTWTNKTFNSQQINNTTYIAVESMGIAYSGAGTAILPSAASATPVSGVIGKVFTPSNNIFVGNAIASIVQID